MMSNGKQVWVNQQSRLICVEGSEHFADGGDPDLFLVEDRPLLGEEDAVCDGGVSVPLCIVVQTHHVAFGDHVQKDGREEGEEADDAAEKRLKRQTLESQPGLQQDLRHQDQAGSTGAV